MNRSEDYVKNERASHTWIEQENGDIFPSEPSDGCWFSAGCYDKTQGKYVYPRVGKFHRSPLDSDASWCCFAHERNYWREKYEALQDMVGKVNHCCSNPRLLLLCQGCGRVNTARVGQR